MYLAVVALLRPAYLLSEDILYIIAEESDSVRLQNLEEEGANWNILVCLTHEALVKQLLLVGDLI